MDQNNNTQAALDAGAGMSQIRTFDRAGKDAKFIVVPEGYALQDLEKFMDAPARTSINPKFHDLDSFIRYVKEFKKESTRVFVIVSDTAVGFVAAIDYHLPEKPAWIGHKADFSAIKTVEWNRWMASNKKAMKQTDFAEFLEANQLAIVAPNGADLLEMIQSLEGHSNAKFKQVKRLSNGRQQLEYQEDIVLKGETGTQTGAMEVPAMLALGLQPFQGGSNYAVAARLRYRIVEQNISFQYELIDPHLVIKSEVGEMMSALEQECGIKAFQGTF